MVRWNCKLVEISRELYFQFSTFLIQQICQHFEKQDPFLNNFEERVGREERNKLLGYICWSRCVGSRKFSSILKRRFQFKSFCHSSNGATEISSVVVGDGDKAIMDPHKIFKPYMLPFNLHCPHKFKLFVLPTLTTICAIRTLFLSP